MFKPQSQSWDTIEVCFDRDRASLQCPPNMVVWSSFMQSSWQQVKGYHDFCSRTDIMVIAIQLMHELWLSKSEIMIISHQRQTVSRDLYHHCFSVKECIFVHIKNFNFWWCYSSTFLVCSRFGCGKGLWDVCKVQKIETNLCTPWVHPRDNELWWA